MKALCFTFDRNMPVMEYVLHTYFKCWPDNPFVFYIPWNNTKPKHLINQYGSDKIKLLQTNSDVKPTIRTLLSVVNENEFIWWAQDDKYIIDFKNKQIIQDLYQHNTSEIGGFMFTKNAGAHKSYLKSTTNIGGYKLIQKKNHHQIFQPQWIKKEIIESLYLAGSLPEHYHLSRLYEVMYKLPVKKLYTTTDNYISIAESIDQGKLTSNIIQDSKKDNFIIKGNFKRCNKTMRYL